MVLIIYMTFKARLKIRSISTIRVIYGGMKLWCQPLATN